MFRLPKIGIADRSGDGWVIRYQKFYFSILEKIFGKFYRKITPHPLNIVLLEKIWKNLQGNVLSALSPYTIIFLENTYTPYYSYLKKFYRKILVNLTINWYLIKKLGGLLLIKQSPLYLCLNMGIISYNLVIYALSTVYLYAF